MLKSYYSRVRLMTASKSEIWHGTNKDRRKRK
nr:MAG TPA: hypothetical protein [Caudoviricetes sp.]DAW34774.1 MAG TPA: hypothetical protein [Caudoviricetes sp.]